MLTATYSFVAITAEHDNARSMLSRLQQYIETTWKSLQKLDLSFLDAAFEKLMRFDRFCRNRKMELYLIPVLRDVSREAEALIAELDSLSEQATALLRSVGDQLKVAFDVESIKVAQLCEAMASYCRYLFARFEKEETELLPLARRVLSVEDWFSIAAQFLSDDAGGSGRKHRAPVVSARPSSRQMVNAG